MKIFKENQDQVRAKWISLTTITTLIMLLFVVPTFADSGQEEAKNCITAKFESAGAGLADLSDPLGPEWKRGIQWEHVKFTNKCGKKIHVNYCFEENKYNEFGCDKSEKGMYYEALHSIEPFGINYSHAVSSPVGTRVRHSISYGACFDPVYPNHSESTDGRYHCTSTAPTFPDNEFETRRIREMDRLKAMVQERQEWEERQERQGSVQQEFSGQSGEIHPSDDTIYPGDIHADDAGEAHNCERANQAWLDAQNNGASKALINRAAQKAVECTIRELKRIRHNYTGTALHMVEGQIKSYEQELERIKQER